jgi:hypothetical protein
MNRKFVTIVCIKYLILLKNLVYRKEKREKLRKRVRAIIHAIACAREGETPKGNPRTNHRKGLCPSRLPAIHPEKE